MQREERIRERKIASQTNGGRGGGSYDKITSTTTKNGGPLPI
jgi:hypothetical protein